MASFSERHGYKEVRSIVQRESLDRETRTDLWNVLSTLNEVFREYERDYEKQYDETEEDMLRTLWTRVLRRPRDEYVSDANVWNIIKSTVLNADWNESLDMLENVVKRLEASKSRYTDTLATAVAEQLNLAFENNLAAYRFIGHEIAPIDSSAEADAVNAAIEDSSPIAGARHSLVRATELLADRVNRDYANSVKESISAVEAVIKTITGPKDDLAGGLKKLEEAGLKIHPALKSAWLKMYGWTSDEDGIRHAGIEAADVDQALAKYALVTCSAFVSYLIEEGRKVGLLK